MDLVLPNHSQFKSLFFIYSENLGLQKMQNPLVRPYNYMFDDFTTILKLKDFQFHQNHFDPNIICFFIFELITFLIVKFRSFLLWIFSLLKGNSWMDTILLAFFDRLVLHIDNVTRSEDPLLLYLVLFTEEGMLDWLILILSEFLLIQNSRAYQPESFRQSTLDCNKTLYEPFRKG